MLGFLFGPSWSTDKLKVQLSLSVNRIKLMKGKKENEIIRREREIAQTLGDGKEELAKVVVVETVNLELQDNGLVPPPILVVVSNHSFIWTCNVAFLRSKR